MTSWWVGKPPAGEDPQKTLRRLAIQKRHRESRRPKNRAHYLVAAALKRGVLIKPVLCEECHKERKLEAHHADYSKPLEVEWLCPRCHGKRQPLYNPRKSERKRDLERSVKCRRPSTTD